MEQIIRMLTQVESGVKVIAVCVVIMAVLAIIRTINSFFTCFFNELCIKGVI